jgi:SRSO17 transposase
MTKEELLSLEPALASYLHTFLFCCDYTQTFDHLGTYVRGLLSDLPRQSVEPIALQAGTPVRSLQEFLKDHVWRLAAVRDLVQHHVGAALAKVADADDLGTVGIIDETGTPKKGTKTPGACRQWCGRLGKVENGIVTVHLGVARGRYKTLVDAELFLPKEWSDDRPRCRAAGIPDSVVHRPKWRIALEELDRATTNGLALDWLTFDEEYGKSPAFVAALDQRQMRFVGAVPRTCSCLAATNVPHRPAPQVSGRTAEQVVHNSRQFRRLEWQVVRLARQSLADQIWRVKAAPVWLHGAKGWSQRTYWLLWASNDETGEEKFFLSNAAADTPVATMVRVGFRRWNVEHTFRVGKTERGFGHFEGRNYVALMRHLSLGLLAMTNVAEQTDRLREKKSGGDGGAGVPGGEPGMPAMAGGAMRSERRRVAVAHHRSSPGTQPGGSPVTAKTTARRQGPQKASTTQKEETKTMLNGFQLAL